MQKLKMHTPDISDENIEKLGELFPSCVTEIRQANGQMKHVVDFDQLRQELSTEIVEGQQERYQLNWPGKRQALLIANAPIAKTLRPCREESVNFNYTKNLFIEGDNLDALKLLQETYLNKIKMIYIDPPYNTGTDFIYNDDFREDISSYLTRSNQKNLNGYNVVVNTESNGRFHSDWLSMIYSRIKLARNLLRDDGVIFISIDDNEVHNLRKICDEIFGEKNFLANIIWEKRFTRSNNSKTFATLTEHILCFRKSDLLSEIKEPRNQKADSIYKNPDNDSRGVWTSVSYVNPATKEQRPNLSYEIKNPITGSIITHPTNAWKYDKRTHSLHIEENKLYWGKDGKNSYPRLKKFLYEMDGGMVPVNLWSRRETGTTDEASKMLEKLMGKKLFDFPKPCALIQRAMNMCLGKNDLILDFFAGSSTTAHAVLRQNAADGGNRKFIMIQLPELCNEKSEAYKSGYKTIAEISKERIRRAGNKIKEENADKPGIEELDVGFRVLKIDNSNMKDVYYTPDKVEQYELFTHINNIREDRIPEDLLFQVLLDWGIDLTLPITQEIICGKTVFFVDTNALVACFDKDIKEELINKLTIYKPLRVVFCDSSFASDSIKINIEQIFKHASPSTEIKTI